MDNTQFELGRKFASIRNKFANACETGNLEKVRQMHNKKNPMFENSVVLKENHINKKWAFLSCGPLFFSMKLTFAEYAGQHGHWDVSKFLILEGHGFDNFFAIAVYEGRMDIVDNCLNFKLNDELVFANNINKMLYYKGGQTSSFDIASRTRDVYYKDGHISPLNIACATGNIDMVEKLLCHGAIPDKYSMYYACNCNIKNDNIVKHILQLLVTQGASAYINIPVGINLHEKLQITYFLINFSFFKSLDFIVSIGYDFNYEDNRGMTLLHILCGKKFYILDRHHIPLVEEIVRFILDNGANVNEKDNLGDTPLHKACLAARYFPNICSILIEKGANIMALNNENKSPLQCAIESKIGYVSGIIRLFTENGFDMKTIQGTF